MSSGPGSAEAVWRALERFARERLATRPGGHLIETRLERLLLEIRLDLRGPEAGPAAFSRRLEAEIDRLLDDVVQLAAAFRPGRAYCHRCESPSCDHAVPPGPRHVFCSYGPTGVPRWEDFAQLCLDRRHPDVDRLFQEPPTPPARGDGPLPTTRGRGLVVLVQQRQDLHGGLLSAFRDRSFDLLGQVTAGFYEPPGPAEARSVLALTAQVALSRGRGGSRRLGLNLLGRTSDGGDVSLAWAGTQQPPWRPAVLWAQSALAAVPLDGIAGGDERRLARQVEGILHGTARRLAHDRRARGRRTRHAQERHASGARPTRKALDDARAVRSENLLIDERAGTLVVLGERGRTHFFTREGQHVSSVRYSRDAIERKLKLELWRPASRAEAERFREATTSTAERAGFDARRRVPRSSEGS